ncbi:MAG: cytochrome c3 family protein, partial [Deltaproteobacteria bacterium]|nr:cytochrome c3 family protein [Deltaproteobacteria bacterium]
MKKPVLYLFAAVLASLSLFVAAYSQEDMTVVDNDVFDNPQRDPSLFRHDDHNEAAGIEDCNECHHVYEEGKKVEESSEDQSCSECHEKETSGNT